MQVQVQSGRSHKIHYRLLWRYDVQAYRKEVLQMEGRLDVQVQVLRKIAVIAIASTPQDAARASLITACPKIEHPTP